MQRTLSEVAAATLSVRIYLAEVLFPVDSGSGSFANFIGLKPYPGGTDGGSAKLYRLLGTDPMDLDCDSLVLCSLEVATRTEPFRCNGDEVVSALIPVDDRVPFVQFSYGNSLRDWGWKPPKPPQPKTRVRLNVGNHTDKDLWLEWTQQVDGGYQLDFYPNGHEGGRDSVSIPYSNGSASFTIDIYKNSNGQKGKHLGSFSYGVSVVTHTDYLQIESPRIQIGGYQYVDLGYASAGQALKVVAQILLEDWLS